MSDTLIQIVAALVAGLGVLSAKFLVTYINKYNEYVLKRLTGRKPEEPTPTVTYSERMTALTRSLVDASSEVDRILKEMSEVSQSREAALVELEEKLGSLTSRQQLLQSKVDSLEKVPLPAIEHFVTEIEKVEKKNAWRDYGLFGLGVLVSTTVAILLKMIFGI